MAERFEVARGAIGELFWNIADAVVVARPRTILGWNPGAEAIFGVTAEEARASAEVINDLLGRAADRFWHLIETGGGEQQLECVEGCEKIFDVRAWRLGDEGDGPVVVVLRDITAAERQISGLLQLNALARELLSESSLDVLLTRIVDSAKELVRADFSALLLVRPGTEEVSRFVYNAPRELFPTRLPRVVGLLTVPIRTKSVARLDDVRGHPAGVGIPVQHPPIAALLAAPIVLGGDAIGELAVANRPERDGFDEVDEAIISELANHGAMAVSLATAQGAHEQVESARRALLDTALHNIRTPLTVAKGFLATIRTHVDELSSEERERAFDAIERAHDRIHRLAEGAVLDSPVTDAAPTGDVVSIGIGGLFEDLRRRFVARAQFLRIELDAVVDESAPAAFTADRRLVRELLEHLVDNALKHSAPGDVVSVTARDGGPDAVRFDISDRGPGIPAHEQARVFDQFYRTAHSMDADVPGAGLGLWVARRLADILGGSIGVSSRPGQGTTFWVTLPLAPS